MHFVDAGQPELADQVHHYYLAINVLKHGRGSSYEELRTVPNLPFAMKRLDEGFFDVGNIAEPEGLIDITVLRFFDGPIKTLSEAYKFPEDWVMPDS